MQTQETVAAASSRSAMLPLFMLAHFGHHLSTAAVIPLLPMIRASYGLDYARSGLLLSAFSVTIGLAQMPAAALSDRVSKRVVVALGLMGTGAAAMGAGLAGSYPLMLAALVLMGLAACTYHAPSSAFLSQTIDRGSRGRFLALHGAAGTMGLMITPFLAVGIANLAGGWHYALLAMGVPSLLGGFLVWRLARAQEKANLKAAALERGAELHPVVILRRLGMLVLFATVSVLLTSSMNSYLPLYLVDKHGVAGDAAGLMLGLVYGGGVLGSPLGGALSDRIGRKPVILLSVAGVGPAMWLMTSLSFGPAMMAAIALYGAILTVRMPVMESLIADVTPARQRATVLGTFYFLTQETAGLFTPVLGWMIDRFGLNDGFSFLALVGVGFSVVVLAMWRRL